MEAISFSKWSDDMEATVTTSVRYTAHIAEFGNTNGITENKADV